MSAKKHSNPQYMMQHTPYATYIICHIHHMPHTTYATYTIHTHTLYATNIICHIHHKPNTHMPHKPYATNIIWHIHHMQHNVCQHIQRGDDLYLEIRDFHVALFTASVVTQLDIPLTWQMMHQIWILLNHSIEYVLHKHRTNTQVRSWVPCYRQTDRSGQGFCVPQTNRHVGLSFHVPWNSDALHSTCFVPKSRK